MMHLGRHLVHAGREPQLRMVLFDLPWLMSKLDKYGIHAVLLDFRTYLEAQEDTEVKLLMQALEMSAPAATAFPEARGLIAAHIACRLTRHAGAHRGLAALIQDLRELHVSAATAAGGPGSAPCLWPRSGSLVQAGGSLTKTLSSAICAPIKCHSVSDSGDLLLTAEARVARLWDIRSGQCIRVLEGFKDSIMAGALCPDGSAAVTIADFNGTDIGRVWDTATGRCTFVLWGHTELIQDLKISADSKWCITASYDTTARLWEIATGECLQTFEGHADYVESASLSADSQRAVTASWDKTARIWDTASGSCIHVLRGHSDRVWHSVIGSGRVVTTSWDGTAGVWDLETGEGLWQLQGHTDVVHSAAISRGGQWVLTTSQDGTARFWDIRAGKCCQVFSGHGANGKAAMSPDGSRMVSVSDSSDNLALVWDLCTGACLKALEGHGHKITGATITADGKWAVTSSWDRTARLWDMHSKSSQGSGHQGRVTSLCAREGSDLVVSAGTDGSMLVWNFRQPEPTQALRDAGQALVLVGGGDTPSLAAAITDSGSMRVRATASNRCNSTAPRRPAHPAAAPRGLCLGASWLRRRILSPAALRAVAWSRSGRGAALGAAWLSLPSLSTSRQCKTSSSRGTALLQRPPPVAKYFFGSRCRASSRASFPLPKTRRIRFSV
uniref:Wd repeat-containing protein n=1 Tax=Tetraselmis sp. GSL018 TaxID=582737 RepID=A0A061SNL6_9CHLO